MIRSRADRQTLKLVGSLLDPLPGGEIGSRSLYFLPSSWHGRMLLKPNEKMQDEVHLETECYVFGHNSLNRGEKGAAASMLCSSRSLFMVDTLGHVTADV